MPPNTFPILLRHGTTTAKPGFCIGQHDIPLSVEGKLAAQGITDRWPDNIERIICSDLCRAIQTAEPLVKRFGLSLEIEPQLREISFGEWENQSWDTLYQNHPKQMQRWGNNWLDEAPPQGESARDLYLRVSQWWQSLAEAQNPLSSTTVIVAHAGSLQALACHLQNQPLEQLFELDIKHCTPLQLV